MRPVSTPAFAALNPRRYRLWARSFRVVGAAPAALPLAAHHRTKSHRSAQPSSHRAHASAQARCARLFCAPAFARRRAGASLVPALAQRSGGINPPLARARRAVALRNVRLRRAPLALARTPRAVNGPLVRLFAALSRSLARPIDCAQRARVASLGSACSGPRSLYSLSPSARALRTLASATPPCARAPAPTACGPCPISAAPSGRAGHHGSRVSGPLWAQPPRWGTKPQASAQCRLAPLLRASILAFRLRKRGASCLRFASVFCVKVRCSMPAF